MDSEIDVEGRMNVDQTDVVVKGDAYEDQEDCDVFLKMDVLELFSIVIIKMSMMSVKMMRRVMIYMSSRHWNMI